MPEHITPGETRAQRKIRKAVEAHGLVAEEITWEPVGQMIEMQGREGGWYVYVKDYGVATGYSTDDVIESIDLAAPMWKDGSLYG